MSLHKWFWDNFLWDHLCCHKSSRQTIYVGHNWSACMGRTRTIYILPGPFMSMHKWSGQTKYNDINGPAGPSMLS